MDTLLFAFANSSTHPLPTLQEEDNAINRLLAPRAQARHFLLQRDSIATLDHLPAAFTLYRNDLALFHFSGHAGRDRLLLADGMAHSGGLAQSLGQCPNLKLVILNGCSTQGQVAALLAAGVPMVLATSAPVDDKKATYFSTHFFEALERQFSVGEAVDMAKAALATVFGETATADFHRGGFVLGETETPTWGLFYKPETEHLTGWKLPAKSQAPATESTADFLPNEFLIQALMEALAPFSPEVRGFLHQEQQQMDVPPRKKRVALVNALPVPLALPLRKLIMPPIEGENTGFDKLSAPRLRQIVRAYETALELLTFTMLAQLWEAHDASKEALDIRPEQRQALQAFFQLTREEREVANLMALIRTVRQIFDQNNIHYFMEELRDLRQLLHNDPDFVEALQVLDGLRVQMRQPDDPGDLAYLCSRGEKSLANLYSQLGFLARYRLTSVKSIDVLKYRHRREPHFNHVTVTLHDLNDGFDLLPKELDRSLDNRSILLLNEETWEYLNLSPFVIDENAFQKQADLCKLYFFSHYLPAAKTWCFKYVDKPDDPLLEVSASKYPLVKEQCDAFLALLTIG